MKSKILTFIKLMNVKLFIVLCISVIIAISVNVYSQKDLLLAFENQNYPFNYFDVLIYALFDKNFVIITILIPNFIITLNAYKKISSMNNYILRLKNRKEFYNSIFDKAYKANCYWYFFIMFLYFIIALFLNRNITILYNPQYNTFNIIYLFFIIFRSFLITQIISLLSISVVILLNSKCSIILNFLLYSSFYLYIYDFSVRIDSLSKFSFYIGDYFTMLPYSSFTRELGFSTGYILFLCIALGIMYSVIISRKSRDLL